MNNETSRKILEEITSYRKSVSNLHPKADHATEKLPAKLFDFDEIVQHPGAAVPAEEIDNAAAKYIDKLKNFENRSIDAKCIIAILRGVEICLNNISALAQRITADVQHGHFDEASIKVTWMNHFNDSLHRFSQLLVQTDAGQLDGDFLSIEDSATFSLYAEKVEAMHETLKTTAAESIDDIAAHDIDNLQRFTFFHSFINTNYETIWLSILRHVRIPGVYRTAGESSAHFYQRIVQSDEAPHDTVAPVDLKDVTYLMQFRAYHHITGIFVGLANDLLAGAILTLVDEAHSSFHSEAKALILCNKALQVISDSMKPIVRTLTPKAYFAISPAVRLISGSHSHKLLKSLFVTLYPALVRSLRLRLANFDETTALDDSAMLNQALQVLRSNEQPELSEMIRHTVSIYQYVRTWRDEHQFANVQVGLSPKGQTPTASVSGTEKATQTIYNFRHTDKKDAISPLYEAVLGKQPADPLDIVHAGRFDEYMTYLTADAVLAMHSGVPVNVSEMCG